jgi:membrane protease subunit HflK
MATNKNGGGKGPWGSSSGGSGSSGGEGKGNTPPPRGSNGQPDIDEFIRKSQEALRVVYGGGRGGKGGKNNSAEPSLKPFLLGGILIIGLWFASGVYRVDADQQGVVLRFGQFHRITGPGLNYRLPSPFETVFTPRITSINREEIGFRSGEIAGNRTNKPEESLMLTGDKNLVSAQFEVQWRIKDAVSYLFNVKDPNFVVRPIAEASFREIMGNTPLSLALSDKRQAIAEETKQQMQQVLDEYATGIEIYEVNLLAVDAPDPVVEAFIDVLAAQQEKETLQNKAAKYRDGIIPVAQGQAEKMIKDAQGYKEAVVAKAQGDAARFSSIYKEYAEAKDITRKRLYLETMEEVLKDMPKMIMKEGGTVPYLPLNELKPQAR